MNSTSTFSGFIQEGVRFLTDIKTNNHKSWFEAHKEDFELGLMAPAREFVMALGERLQTIAPGIHADPRVNGSIFRIHRDTRFSMDKTPYKTHLGIWLWEGSWPKLECPGFYFHLEPPTMMVGGGLHIFSDPLLQTYRDSVVDPEYGSELDEALKQVAQAGNYQVSGKHYKRVPRGFDPHHPRAELLQFNGLSLGFETPIPDELYSPGLVDYCYSKYVDMLPLHTWLLRMTERAPQTAAA
jgi:uncharacterized protein (TIGR02453 family)